MFQTDFFSGLLLLFHQGLRHVGRHGFVVVRIRAALLRIFLDEKKTDQDGDYIDYQPGQPGDQHISTGVFQGVAEYGKADAVDDRKGQGGDSHNGPLSSGKPLAHDGADKKGSPYDGEKHRKAPDNQPNGIIRFVDRGKNSQYNGDS